MFLRLPMMTVITKGTAMAISMAMAKVPMDWGCMDRMPGRPPTPMEFAVEAQKLLQISLEGSVG